MNTSNLPYLDTPLLIAHRGGSLEVPENTMAAFRHAIDVGMRMVELDVQMTRDGELVVIHDETVDRTTNGIGPVGSFTLEELQRLDAGFKFDASYTDDRIPTLREVFDLCVPANVGVVVEIKHPEMYPGLEEKVVALIGEMWLRGAENIWCISFDHECIRRLRTLDPVLPLGYLFEPYTTQFVRPDDTVQAFCPYYRTPLQFPEQVAEAHEMGKLVLVYTVDDPQEVRALADVGVDGMVTDAPAALLQFLNK
ncbi:MAG: glycerophosphoryl diester phosphodiesterase [Chloroflexia bacterium]|jgi:glycerophosphoryl diester phosphodiesterase|nr:glycerophosphoryl diester phosphodiesterase [Chloroflexia bacterium]